MSNQNISIIVAISENGVIGKSNSLIWHLPADLKHFKQLTVGHHIVMGRKTFESIGKPLPQRTSIIVSRNNDFKADNCFVVNTLEDAFSIAKNDSEIFIIGGGEIYKNSIEFANKLYITEIHQSFDGDTFFPDIEWKNWELIDEIDNKIDDKNKYHYVFKTYIKKLNIIIN